MSWVESDSEHFQSRHSSDHERDAARVLALLERVRERTLPSLVGAEGRLTVVLHDTPLSLSMSHPMMVMEWRAAAASSRRYVTGWFNPRELHVLSPEALRSRASQVQGSFETLRLAPASLYLRRLITAANVDLAPARAPTRRALERRWAWLFEGASRWLSGEADHARSLVAARVRQGGRISFPPPAREAPLLAATLMEVLARQHGAEAVTQVAARLPSGGPQAALTRAFGGKALLNIESDWRQYLRELADL